MDISPSERCASCIGNQRIACEAARLVLQSNRRHTEGLDPDLQAIGLQTMARNVARRIVDQGCEFSIDDVQQQMT